MDERRRELIAALHRAVEAEKAAFEHYLRAARVSLEAADAVREEHAASQAALEAAKEALRRHVATAEVGKPDH